MCYINPNPTSRVDLPDEDLRVDGRRRPLATRGPVWDDYTKSWNTTANDYRDEKAVSIYSAYLYSTVVELNPLAMSPGRQRPAPAPEGDT